MFAPRIPVWPLLLPQNLPCSGLLGWSGGPRTLFLANSVDFVDFDYLDLPCLPCVRQIRDHEINHRCGGWSECSTKCLWCDYNDELVCERHPDTPHIRALLATIRPLRENARRFDEHSSPGIELVVSACDLVLRAVKANHSAVTLTARDSNFPFAQSGRGTTPMSPSSINLVQQDMCLHRQSVYEICQIVGESEDSVKDPVSEG